MIENSFFSPSKLFKLFWPVFFGHAEKGLGKKPKVYFKIYDVMDCKQAITIYLLQKISRNNDNQTIKFGQLMEYNMRNIFSENSYQKYGGETISRPFPKKLKLSISLG